MIPLEQIDLNSWYILTCGYGLFFCLIQWTSSRMWFYVLQFSFDFTASVKSLLFGAIEPLIYNLYPTISIWSLLHL